MGTDGISPCPRPTQPRAGESTGFSTPELLRLTPGLHLPSLSISPDRRQEPKGPAASAPPSKNQLRPAASCSALKPSLSLSPALLLPEDLPMKPSQLEAHRALQVQEWHHKTFTATPRVRATSCFLNSFISLHPCFSREITAHGHLEHEEAQSALSLLC